ncbi:hypothetical protein HPP92_025852 [Vanilla planifolia]|uniref:Cytochrome P450 n=1 Tax=Vanilla planifolia TaxID=51239 RepID=A0A835U8R7_VANPL|nr:hypothetical protein HPP92_025852 [Vanilla planifolia]
METVVTCFTCFALFLSLHLINKLVFTKKKGKVKLPPSPPSLPFLGHLHYLYKPLHHSLARLSARYGPVLLLQLGTRRTLVVSSACLAEECFTTNDHAFSNRPHLPSASINTYNHTMLPIKKLQSYRDAFMQAIVEEHRIRKARAVEGRKEADEEEEESNNRGRHKTMIEALLSLQKEQPGLYTDRYIKSLLLGLLTGGTDTTSNVIEWAISLLLNNPEIFERAREEIVENVGEARLVEESDLGNFPYLHCIIQETLRMYPAGPLIPRESIKECKVGGYIIPPRTILLTNAYAIQRNPKLWVEPMKFIPERFLNDAKLQMEGKMLPFGKGRRSCPGEGLAMKEMALVRIN